MANFLLRGQIRFHYDNYGSDLKVMMDPFGKAFSIRAEPNPDPHHCFLLRLRYYVHRGRSRTIDKKEKETELGTFHPTVRR